jgi:flagellar protein FlaG
VDKPTGKTVIKVMDRESDEIIRQIPPENLLKLMTNMRDVMGMLLDVEI